MWVYTGNAAYLSRSEQLVLPFSQTSQVPEMISRTKTTYETNKTNKEQNTKQANGSNKIRKRKKRVDIKCVNSYQNDLYLYETENI